VPTRRTIHYSGRVQGVGFRWTVTRELDPLDVTGYVRNLPDGRVRLVLEGELDELERAQQRVRQAMGRYIADEVVEEKPASGRFSTFEIRR